MNPFTKWIYTFFTTILIIFGLTAGLNYIADPLGVNTRWVEEKYKPIIGDEKEKFNYLFKQENYAKIDTVILGSTRTMSISSDSIPRVKHAYNLGTTSASFAEELYLLEQWLTRPNSQLKTVLLGIDFLMFDEKNNQMKLSQIENKFKTNNPSSANALLSFDTLLLSMRCIENQLLGKPIVYFRDDGSMNYYLQDQQIQENEFDFSDKRMLRDAAKAYIPHQQAIYDQKALKYLSAIKELCLKNKVELIPFITPEHSTLFSLIMNNSDLREKHLTMRKDLSLLFDEYYDFGGFNEINSINENFYDNLHYRPAVGTLIVTQLLAQDNKKKSEQYGRLVTRKTIQSHLQQAAFYPPQKKTLEQSMK